VQCHPGERPTCNGVEKWTKTLVVIYSSRSGLLLRALRPGKTVHLIPGLWRSRYLGYCAHHLPAIDSFGPPDLTKSLNAGGVLVFYDASQGVFLSRKTVIADRIVGQRW
jgi:hypothetical protein